MKKTICNISTSDGPKTIHVDYEFNNLVKNEIIINSICVDGDLPVLKEDCDPNTMKARIKNHFEKEYSSSPHDVSDEEIDFIIKNDCICQKCGKSIFELYDFPEINIEKDILLCEYCYDDEYRDICSICEESYDKEDLSKEFPKSPFYYIGNQKKSGIYHALRWPVFSAAIGGLGDTIIWWSDVEFICSIEDFLKLHDPEIKYDFSNKWKEFLEDDNVEYAEFIGSCCYEEALKIKNNNSNDNSNRT